MTSLSEQPSEIFSIKCKPIQINKHICKKKLWNISKQWLGEEKKSYYLFFRIQWSLFVKSWVTFTQEIGPVVLK